MSQIYNETLARACKDILQAIDNMPEPREPAVRNMIRSVCMNYSLAKIPSNEVILAHCGEHASKRVRRALLKRPVKTASGVAVVALMPMPYACPHGRCTYCPGGPKSGTPNSYVGSEPIATGAISVDYDPASQVRQGLERLRSYGHDTSKIELVIVGGTFLFMPREYCEWFVKSCYDSLNGHTSDTLEAAKSFNERAVSRCVGLTIETKPDYCKRTHVDMMLIYGATRVEIGIQCLRERVYNIVNRGHTYDDVIESIRISRDSGYKIVAHMMPGLPTMSVQDDIEDFEKLWSDPLLRPDMLKIYPSLVIPGTPLHNDYLSGRYVARSENDTIDMLARIKPHIPHWVRVMRIQREIASDEIAAGARSGNLRQQVHERMRREHTRCMCIRCREAGIAGIDTVPDDGLEMNRTDYESSHGHETFLSMDDSDDHVYAYLRLRRPSESAHRAELRGHTCIIREVHALGRQMRIGDDSDGIQHSGLGTRLVREAERIAREDYDAKKLLVISAVGTRQYYARLGYKMNGPYMSQELSP